MKFEKYWTFGLLGSYLNQNNLGDSQKKNYIQKYGNMFRPYWVLLENKSELDENCQ